MTNYNQLENIHELCDRKKHLPVVKNLTGQGVFDLMYSFFWCTEYCENTLCKYDESVTVVTQWHSLKFNWQTREFMIDHRSYTHL